MWDFGIVEEVSFLDHGSELVVVGEGVFGFVQIVFEEFFLREVFLEQILFGQIFPEQILFG